MTLTDAMCAATCQQCFVITHIQVSKTGTWDPQVTRTGHGNLTPLRAPAGPSGASNFHIPCSAGNVSRSGISNFASMGPWTWEPGSATWEPGLGTRVEDMGTRVDAPSSVLTQFLTLL